MRYEENEIQNVTIVSVHGDIIGDQSGAAWSITSGPCSRKIAPASCSTSRDVRHVDSRGLGELIECYRAAQSRSGAVKLLGVNGRLSDLLVITKLASVFECFDTREAAIASFAPLAVAC